MAEILCTSIIEHFSDLPDPRIILKRMFPGKMNITI